MQTKLLLSALAALAVAAPAVSWAEDTLSPGDYTATISPAPDESTADAIEKQLGDVEGIGSVDVKPEDGSLHFTVEEGAAPDESGIMDVVRAAAPGTTVGPAVSQEGSSGTGGSSTGETGTGGTQTD